MLRPHRLALPTLPLLLLVTLAIPLAAAGCDDPKKNAAANAPRAPEPIPSDFVVNGFFPAGSAEPPKVQIRSDGGTVALGVDAAGGSPTPDDPNAAASPG